MTGAHQRVGTTYAQLVAALAAANRYGTYISILLLLSIAKTMLYSVVFQGPSPDANFTFLSRIHSNLLVDGLSTQSGWGHVWNRYARPLSCPCQPHQCSLTPAPPACLVGRPVAKPHFKGCQEIVGLWCAVVKHRGGGCQGKIMAKGVIFFHHTRVSQDCRRTEENIHRGDTRARSVSLIVRQRELKHSVLR